MPKPVKLAKGKSIAFGRTGQASKYPWDEWFNPDPKKYPDGLLELCKGNLKEGADYDVDTDMMPGKIKAAARRRYKVVQIARKDAEGNKLVDSLIIKARDMMADERNAEDLRRAEEKAKREEEAAAAEAAGEGAENAA